MIGTWSSGSPSDLLANLPPRYYHESVVDADNMVYLVGGYDGVTYFNDLWRYNSTFYEQLSGGKFTPRSMFSVILNIYLNQLYVLAGFTGKADAIDVWSYSASSGTTIIRRYGAVVHLVYYNMFNRFLDKV